MYFYPNTPVNILGVTALGTLFGDNSDATDILAEDGTTIKLGSTRSHFICDRFRHERHFMHGSSNMPGRYIYVGHVYFKSFCTRVHKFFFDKLHFAFSSEYSINPQTSDIIHSDGPHIIPYDKGDLDGEDPHHQWYRPDI